MKKILIVPDIPGWVMEFMGEGIISGLGDEFEFDVKYSDKLSLKYGKEVINWEKDYEKYDIIYLMMSGYMPLNLPDYSKIVTSFHGGPGTESQANNIQRWGLENMRISYVSNQTKKRVTKIPYSSSEKLKVKTIIEEKIIMEDLKKKLAIRDGDKIEIDDINNKKVEGEIEVRARYTKNGFGLKNLCFTPQGVDIDNYYQKEIINNFVCGYAGWLQYLNGSQENHRRGHWIMNAWNRNARNSFKLNIAGGLKNIGGARKQIDDFMDKNSNDKIKIGLYDRKDMIDFYKGISCYLVPDRLAGGPMPVLEAGAMGIPIICTDAGHCGDFIEDNVHGKKIKSYNQFCDAIDWMKKHGKERKKMGKNLQEYIREHRSWKAVASYWRDFFNGV